MQLSMCAVCIYLKFLRILDIPGAAALPCRQGGLVLVFGACPDFRRYWSSSKSWHVLKIHENSIFILIIDHASETKVDHTTSDQINYPRSLGSTGISPGSSKKMTLRLCDLCGECHWTKQLRLNLKSSTSGILACWWFQPIFKTCPWVKRSKQIPQKDTISILKQ